jgi:hypothetical protein
MASQAPAHGLDIDTSDDDFDMHIDRDFSAASMPPSQWSPSSRPGSMSGAPPSLRPSGAPVARSGAPGALGSGLEVSYRRTDARALVDDGATDPTTGQRIAGWFASLTVAGAAAAGLFRLAHRPAGISLTGTMPHAFDGTSMIASGALSLVALAAAITVGWLGLRVRPRSWAWVSAGGGLLLIALAMVTVTLASSGENSAPPDGALLVPYLAPLTIGLFALGTLGRAASLFARDGVLRKVSTIPVAAVAGAIAFFAIETAKAALPG